MPRSRHPAASSPFKPLNPPYLDSGAGGKRRLADFVVAQAPEAFGTYFEPFLDGGAVAIAAMERFPGAAFQLSSEHAEAVVTWEALAQDAASLISLVREHTAHHGRAHLADVLAMHIASLSDIERAARYVYLRGGIDRETVAFDESNAARLGALLAARDVRFATQHFFAIVSAVAEDDFVFLDPPFAADGDAGAGAGGAARDDLVGEVRSLVGTLTARGAYVLAPGRRAGRSGAEGAPGEAASAGADGVPYSSWNTMALVADRGGGETVWANRTLDRAARRRA